VLLDEAGHERKLKIFRAHIGNASLSFQAKDAVLALDEIQLEGKRRMNADEFLRGYHGAIRLAW
ncbi:MAG: hypothetical protein ABR611_12930, partial [Chthoniobacterales bacterium]